ncbi:MAG: ABC transporter permease [Gemmatimonas sp.]|jgi:lipoprotein-releasing system permease protein|uniref:ABC transporter permease n=2 Tax=Gemmatimonas sp. TaxID=1962908 RepID=UPI0022CA875F|nr:FtsX-like permease family protein [Gemmatimonas sp.]MCA2984975.1 ABC transporter permease [Gemmatimonas sp.]MCA2985990.1 ABC transporter permease [Gemmatimonas sp.]MCA2995298.1 ABC transporter permease [Gemmatimonas sp.]MCE2954031.1 FtsX-like permease family protein [Gemmatimonas sp.]MCZ8012445.1 FtsX-like permease family protein [Gemmatimonas sp.]
MSRWAPFEWIVALRFLRQGRAQTLFIMTGIAIGVGVIVFMSAMLASLQANFVTRTLTAQAHIQILPPEELPRPLRVSTAAVVQAPVIQRPVQRQRSIDQWQTIVSEVKSYSEVTNVTPTVSTSALALRGDASRSITITGIEPAVYFRIVRLPDYLVSGEPRLSTEEIIIGSELARELGLSVADKLSITTAGNTTRRLTVSGIFDLGNKGANQRSTFVALRTAQTLANLAGGVTSIDITVRDLFAADSVAVQLAAATGMQADSWISTNAQLFSTLSAQEMSFVTIELFVALSVAFGIASVLSVTVIQRSQEIGILRAMGTSQRQVLGVFLLQGALLGLLGALVGAAVGSGALKLFHDLVRLPDGGELFPFSVEPVLLLLTVLLATVTGVLAASVPALNASRLDPVVAIRG